MTADPEANNQRMNDPIDLSMPINKYFERIDKCIQYVDGSKIYYTAAQVFQKYHHAVLALVLYVRACRELRKNTTNKQMLIGFKILFVDK